jgi:hypothetical protein
LFASPLFPAVIITILTMLTDKVYQVLDISMLLPSHHLPKTCLTGPWTNTQGHKLGHNRGHKGCYNRPQTQGQPKPTGAKCDAKWRPNGGQMEAKWRPNGGQMWTDQAKQRPSGPTYANAAWINLCHLCDLGLVILWLSQLFYFTYIQQKMITTATVTTTAY